MATGAELLWRGKHNLRLPREAALTDDSYLTTIYPSDKNRRHPGARGRVPVGGYLEWAMRLSPLDPAR